MITNPILPSGVGLGGMRIIEDRNMVVTYEDWTEVRSHGRAKRRRAQGKPQRIRIKFKPDTKVYHFQNTLVMHPEMARQIERLVK